MRSQTDDDDRVVGCGRGGRGSAILHSTDSHRMPTAGPPRVARCVLAVPLMVVVGACTAPSTTTTNGGGSTTAASAATAAAVDPAVLVRQEKSFEAATASQGPMGWVSYFNDSSASFPPEQLIQMGRDAERRAITGALGDSSGHLQWTPTYSFIARSGDLGYTYGYYRLRRRDSKAKLQQRTGTYVTIWRRQSDSSWKVAVDVGSPGPIPLGFFDSVAK